MEKAFIVVSGRDKGRTFLLRDAEITIGRDPSCAISLNGSRVSRYHALVRPVGNQFELRDLQSSNGTFINGCRIDRQPLRAGDSIKIGNTRFSF